MVSVSAFTDARFVGLWSTSWIGQFQEYIIYIFVYVNIDYIYIIYVYFFFFFLLIISLT